MGILDFFFARRETASAGVAKERLQLVLAHERAGRDAPDFLPAMQRELLAVVGKYVAVKEEYIRVNLARQNSASVLEINIEFDPAQPAVKPDGRPPQSAAGRAAGPPAAANHPALAGPHRGKTLGKRR